MKKRVKMCILGEARAEKLGEYGCPHLVRLFYTARRLCRVDSAPYTAIRTQLFARLAGIICDVAAHAEIPLLDRHDYLARSMASLIRSLDNIPADKFCSWARTVAYTEAISMPRFWQTDSVPGFLSDQRLQYIAMLETFLDQVEYELGSQPRAVVQKKMRGWSDSRIAHDHDLDPAELQELLAEIADSFGKCH